MSGGRFVLSILAVIVAYSLGVYVLSNWNSPVPRTESPSAESEKKVASRTSVKNEEEQGQSKSEPAKPKSDGLGESSAPAKSPVGKKISSSPVQKLDDKPVDDRPVANIDRLSEKTADLDIKAKSSEITPTFDVVRVEPTGEGVIAGRSEPGWNIRIEAGEKVIGQAKADRDGQWVVVIPENVLDAGTHELGLKSVAPEGKGSIVSNQKVRVALEKSKSAKPRIVLAEAGKPEKVIQPGKPDLSEVVDKTTTPPDAGNIIKESKQKNLASGTGKSSDQFGKESPAIGKVEIAEEKSVTETTRGTKRTAATKNIPDVKESANDQIKIAKKTERTKSRQSDKIADLGLSSKTTKADRSTQKKIASEELKKSDIKVADSDKDGFSNDRNANVGIEQQKSEKVQTGKNAETDRDVAEKKKSIVSEVVDSFFGNKKKINELRSAPAGGNTKTVMKPIPVPLVSVRSVEYERSVENSGFLSIEGEGLPGARVNIFLNDKQIGATKADSSGVWRFYKSVVIKPGQYMIQAKQVDQSGKTLALASKPFERVLPKAVTIGSVKVSSEEIDKEVKAEDHEQSKSDRKEIASQTKPPVSTKKSDKEQINTRVAERSPESLLPSSPSGETGRDQGGQVTQKKISSAAAKEPVSAREQNSLNNDNSKHLADEERKDQPADKHDVSSVKADSPTGVKEKKSVTSNEEEDSKEVVQKKIPVTGKADLPTSMLNAPNIANKSEVRTDQKKKVAAVENVDKTSAPKNTNKSQQETVTENIAAETRRTGSKKVKKRKTTSKRSRKRRTTRTYKSRNRRHIKSRKRLSLSRSRVKRQGHYQRIRRHWMKISTSRASTRKSKSLRPSERRRRLRSLCVR